ncbi:MAG: hypothetical protein JWP81_7 [Ferruginibacter sp.]|nr:hypothetical protein [Ferruginibacter sp.]
MSTVTVRDRQTTVDIAMQEAGTAEACIAVAEGNAMSVTDDLFTGQLVKTTPVIYAETVKTFFKENRHPASAETLLDNAGLEGIDYWAVEVDFVVS